MENFANRMSDIHPPSSSFVELDECISASRSRASRWNIPSSLFESIDRAYDRLLAIFIFITIFLPAGSVYGFNFKYPLYLLLLPSSVVVLFHRKRATRLHLMLLVLMPAMLAVWIGIGLIYGFDLPGILRQFTDIFLTLLLCWLAALYCGNDEDKQVRFLRLVVNASVASALMKIGLIAYALLRGIPIAEMVLWIDKVFNVDLMTMSLGNLLGRVQFMSDEIIPLCLFIVLRHRDRLGFSNLRASISTLLLLLSVIISFSRYFWIFAAVSILLGLLLGRRDRFKVLLLSIVGGSVLASLPALVSLYQLRFSSAVAGESDLERAEQIPPLKSLFFDAPLFGHGLGSFNPVLLRSEIVASRYSYEIQVLALPGQLGMIGVGLLCLLLVIYFRRLFWRSVLTILDRLALFTLLLLWLAAGITNPLLFHPVSGVNYASLAALCLISSKEPRHTDGQLH